MEITVKENVIAQLASIAITSVANVSNVQMTHSVTNVNKRVTAIRMELLSVLMLMEDVSVKQTGLDQNAILTALLGLWKETVLNT